MEELLSLIRQHELAESLQPYGLLAEPTASGTLSINAGRLDPGGPAQRGGPGGARCDLGQRRSARRGGAARPPWAAQPSRRRLGRRLSR